MTTDPDCQVGHGDIAGLGSSCRPLLLEGPTSRVSRRSSRTSAHHAHPTRGSATRAHRVTRADGARTGITELVNTKKQA